MVLGAALSRSAVVHAQDADDDGDDVAALLDSSVVSTASQRQESASAAPATTVVISADDLRRHGVRTLDEALNFVSMGTFVGAPSRGGGDVSVRGVGFGQDYGAHTLLLLDGHTLNEPWAAAAYFDRAAAIPLELIDHIEVVLGPGSVIYGSSAMLGTINVVTKRARDLPATYLVGEVEANAGTEQGGRRLRLDGSSLGVAQRYGIGFAHPLRALGDDAEVVGQVEWYRGHAGSVRYQNQTIGDDSVTGLPKSFGPHSPPGVWGGAWDDATLTSLPVAYLKLSFGEFQAKARFAYWKRSYPGMTGGFDATGDFDFDRWSNYDLAHRTSVGARTTLGSRLFADVYSYHQNLSYPSPEDCPQLVSCRYHYWGGSSQLGLEERLEHDWARDGSQQSMLGLVGTTRNVRSAYHYEDASGVAAPSTGSYNLGERAGAIYAQHVARFGRAISVNGGARLDVDDRYGSAFSPRAAISADTWPGGSVRVNYSQAFRAPSAYEVYDRDPSYSVASRDLKAEYVLGGEVSVEQRAGAQRFTLGVFGYNWRDLIQYRQLTQAELAAALAAGDLTPGTTVGYTFANVDRLQSAGINLAAEGRAGSHFRWGGSLTLARARAFDDATGKYDRELPTVPDTFGNLRASYELGGTAPTFGLAARFVGRRASSGLYESGYEGPDHSDTHVGLLGSISGRVPGAERLGYRLGASTTLGQREPYLTGPLQYATTSEPRGYYQPVTPLRVFVGLQWDVL